MTGWIVLLLCLTGLAVAAAPLAGHYWSEHRPGRRRTPSPPATAALPAGLPPVPLAARHRRTTVSPGTQTATGVIRRIDPRMLPDQKATPR